MLPLTRRTHDTGRPAYVGVFRRQTSHLAPGALYLVVYECIEVTRTSIWDVLLFAHFTKSAGPNLVFGADGINVACACMFGVGERVSEEMFILSVFQEFTKRTDDGASSSLKPNAEQYLVCMYINI